MTSLYHFANIFFFVFHVALILFNLLGWTSRRLRGWNLLALSFTAFSWFVLGIFYGFGYCFLTDWHWTIREKLGLPNPHNSYIQFLINSIFPITLSEETIDAVTAILFFAAVTASLFFNVKDLRKRRQHS